MNGRTLLTTALSHIPFCLQRSLGGFPEPLTTLARADLLLKVFVIVCPPRTITASKNRVRRDNYSVNMHKTRPNHLHLFTFSTCSKNRTLEPNTLRLTCQLLLNFSRHILPTTVFKHRRCSRIFCPQHPCF